jgi:hypothetical protein
VINLIALSQGKTLLIFEFIRTGTLSFTGFWGGQQESTSALSGSVVAIPPQPRHGARETL